MQRAWRASVLAAIALVTGCGGDDAATEIDTRLPAAGGRGTLTYAVPRLPANLDPLAARDRIALAVTRQVHEPLVAELSGPYGDTSRRPGLASTAVPSEGGSVWTLTLRPGVRFQDGTPFNARAVLANARRWTTLAAGRRLLPELFAVDAPRPDQVRFLLESPVPDLAARLSAPRLGIVSPQALERQGEGRSRLPAGAMGTGTGAFELGTHGERRVELSRYANWWGSSLGLGPALDGVTFLAIPQAERRLRLLEDGSVQVADPLGAVELATVAADPLLAAIRDGRRGIGLQRSVRGIDLARAVPILSRVWLTDLPG
jgi:peptide/nickel transport system substrate-binding protein